MRAPVWLGQGRGVELNYLANKSGNSDRFSWTVGSRQEIRNYNNNRKETGDEFSCDED